MTEHTRVNREVIGLDHDESGRLIRPYAMTGGRTLTTTEISLEAQIEVNPRFDRDVTTYRWESARVVELVELVESPMALVEISARLGIPIGVTRVLVADLVSDGTVMIHAPKQTRSYSGLLERVLDGVRNL